MSVRSGISPSSSASQRVAESINAVEGVEVSRCLEAIVELAKLGLVDSEQVRAMTKQSFGAYHAYLRTTGSRVASPASSASGASALSGSVAASVSDLDWRRNSKSVLRGKPGYCYTALLCEDRVEESCASLGRDPSFYSLMALPGDCVLPDDQLEMVKFSSSGGAVCHVGHDGEHTAKQVLSSLAKTSVMPYLSDVSLWARMRACNAELDSGMQARYPMTASLGAETCVLAGRVWRLQVGLDGLRLSYDYDAFGVDSRCVVDAIHKLVAQLPPVYDCYHEAQDLYLSSTVDARQVRLPAAFMRLADVVGFSVSGKKLRTVDSCQSLVKFFSSAVSDSAGLQDCAVLCDSACDVSLLRAMHHGTGVTVGTVHQLQGRRFRRAWMFDDIVRGGAASCEIYADFAGRFGLRYLQSDYSKFDASYRRQDLERAFSMLFE